MRRILTLTGLIEVFSVYASVEDAVRIARRQRPPGNPRQLQAADEPMRIIHGRGR